MLLAALDSPTAPSWMREIPAVAILRCVWIQNYQWEVDHLTWRDSENLPPAAIFISSPYGLEAQFARKHTTQWVGYKIHITEACDDDRPYLITHVTTTSGPVADGAVTPTIHAALQERQFLPSTHIVDTGFLDVKLLVDTLDDYGVDLFGATRRDYHWQAQEDA